MNKFEQILRVKLEDLRDEGYGDFVAKGVPGVLREKILGVRIPEIRGVTGYALDEIFGKKGWSKTEAEERGIDKGELYREMNKFLEDLPHPFLEYDIAHAQIIAEMNNFEECILGLDKFLPYVNNWIVCDTINPKVFRKNLEGVWGCCERWVEAEEPFIERFAIVMMMRYFLDEEHFFKEQFKKVEKVAWRAETYYVRMAVAWYFATALSKQWEAALSVLTEERLPKWVHNKTIQKAVESRRISPEQKDLLKGLRLEA